ncbi:MAG: hypothetical protein K0Q94_638, partial [Paenibacillus sp.]|nr:hypothetical protein [Paenibacillus sp.]
MVSKMQGWGNRFVACLLVLTLLAQFVPAPERANAEAPASEALEELIAAVEAGSAKP